jgi:glycosyltransferase involved in cell wall biosynthesis
MSARSKVSVIIPAYNVEAYIGAAIDSALAQTYPDTEVVVVNDGSTDGTLDVIERYRGRITIVDQPNGGASAARNVGIWASSGELIALLDGDDLWLPERTERLVALLESRPDLGMVTSDSYVMDGFTPTERRSYIHRRKRPFPAHEDDQIAEIARRNFLFISVVFRRSLLEQAGMFADGVPGAEDYELWLRFLLTGARAGYLDEPLGYYRVRPGSLSQSPAHRRAHQVVLERHLPALWKLGARGYARDAYAIGVRYANQGRRKEAAQFFFHAVRGEEVGGSRLKLALSCVRCLVAPTSGAPIDVE